MIENDTLALRGDWSVRGYKAGTVSLGDSVTVRTEHGWFMGRPIEMPYEPVFEFGGQNLITATGQSLIGDMLIDVSSFDTGLTYHAIGTSSTAVASGDFKLGAESNRLAITSKSRNGNVLTYSTFFTAAQSAVSIQEAGLFGHNTASTASNSGILFNHYLVYLNNSASLYDVTMTYTLTIGS